MDNDLTLKSKNHTVNHYKIIGNRYNLHLGNPAGSLKLGLLVVNYKGKTYNDISDPWSCKEISKEALK